MSSGGALVPAVFLDRDGTINVEREGALKDPAAVELIPGAARAIGQLRDAGFATVVVSNQSAVARGWMSEDDLARVQEELVRQLAAEGARVDLLLHCPHHPTEGEPPLRQACDCRKPAAGMFVEATERLGLDLARSWVIGDAERDLAAGASLGLPGILVGTGKGRAELDRIVTTGGKRPLFCADLAAAVRHVLE